LPISEANVARQHLLLYIWTPNRLDVSISEACVPDDIRDDQHTYGNAAAKDDRAKEFAASADAA